MPSPKPVQESNCDSCDSIVIRDTREPIAYAPPKLEKMQKLSQVTGAPVLTGIP